MQVIDSHVHVVADEPSRFPLADGAGSLPNGAWWVGGGVSIDEFERLRAASGVDAAVLVQAVGAYGVDNRYCISSARAAGHACIAMIDLDSPDVLQRVGELDHDEVVGARLFDFPMTSSSRLEHTVVDGIVDWVEESRRTLSVVVPPDHLGAVRSLAVRTEATVVIEHCGFVDLDSKRGRADLDAFSEIPNVAVKVTGHVIEGLDAPNDAVSWLVGRFGCERVMWGSDWPQTDSSYTRLVDDGRRSVSDLSAEQAAMVLGGCAGRVFGLG